MSQYLGRNKQKSKLRRQTKEQIAFQKRILEQEGNPLKQLMFGSQEAIDRHDKVFKDYIEENNLKTETDKNN